MSKLVEWLRSETPVVKKEKKPVDSKKVLRAGGMLACGALAAFGCYKLYKEGVIVGRNESTNYIRNKLLHGSTWDVPAKDDKTGDRKFIVTICGIVSNNEDEYVENLANYYKNRECSEEFIEKNAKIDRENYQNRLSKYMNG